MYLLNVMCEDIVDLILLINIVLSCMVKSINKYYLLYLFIMKILKE